jgi:hypothetical protein
LAGAKVARAKPVACGTTPRWQPRDGGELSDAAAGREWSQAGWFARKAVWCGGGLADILALWRQCREVAGEVAGGRRAWPGAVGGSGLEWRICG